MLHYLQLQTKGGTFHELNTKPYFGKNASASSFRVPLNRPSVFVRLLTAGLAEPAVFCPVDAMQVSGH